MMPCRPTGALFLASGSRLLACLAYLMLGLVAIMDSAPGCAGCPLALIDLLHARRGLDACNPVPTCICTPPPDLLRPLTTLFSSSFSFCIYNKALTHAPFIIIYSVQSPSSRITDIQSHTFCNPLTIFFFVFNMYIDSALVCDVGCGDSLQRWGIVPSEGCTLEIRYQSFPPLSI